MNKPRINRIGDKWACAGVFTVYGNSPQDAYEYYKIELAQWGLLGAFKDEFKALLKNEGGGFLAGVWLKFQAWLLVYVGKQERWRYEL